MSQSKFPPGWDEDRVRKVLAHYEEQTEDEAAFRDDDRTFMEILKDLLPEIRSLVARHQTRT